MLLGEGGTLKVDPIEDVSSKVMVRLWLLFFLLLLPSPHVPPSSLPSFPALSIVFHIPAMTLPILLCHKARSKDIN